jgi:type IV pilus assembly protein PilA
MKKIIKRLKDQRGLTLIELLAVVVILGIIAAIAVPSVGKIIDNTKQDAKVAEALQIINAAKIAQASDSTKSSWVYKNAEGTTTHGELDEYLNSVKDTSFTVNFDSSTGSYTITGHDSAPVVDSTYDDDNAVPESELVEKAQ